MKVVVNHNTFVFPLPLLKSSPTHPWVSRSKNGRIKAEIEIRICVNRSCRRQGSRETLEILSGLCPPHVSVNSCGCLGRCGAGPNLVVLPDGVFFGHCGTPARAAELLGRSLCGYSDSESDPSRSLVALSLRKRAEEELQKSNFSEAQLLLSQAIDLKPFGGLHIIHRNRSAARLAMGNLSGALEDAKEALTIAPQYPQAYICQGDAFLAMDELDAAEKSYTMALQIDPSIRRSKSFKARIAQLQQKLSIADMPS